MGALCKYRRRQSTTVVAVRLDLDTTGFTYQKWGGRQRCKRGDWIVSNAGDTYTVDAATFERTYRGVSPGVYEKTGLVWARAASEPGVVRTKEGSTEYAAGDFLVFNDPDGQDGYAMSAETFESLYEPAE